MPQSNSRMIHKLQQALNDKFEARVLVNKQQFYSGDQDRPVTFYVVKKAVFDSKKNRYSSVEIFKTMSEIQVVLFLRDMWYELNGWEIPTDNETWNKLKANYAKKSGRGE